MAKKRKENKSGYLILIVDDLPEMRVLRREYLEACGFRVVEAEDGEDGIRKAKMHSPRLILMNYLMPRMNGLEAVKRIRKVPRLRRIPIIMNSACDEKDMRAPALAAGCMEYIEEPVYARTLLDVITAHILVG